MFVVFAIMAYEIGNTSAIEWRRIILSPRKDNLCTFDKKIRKPTMIKLRKEKKQLRR